MKYLADFKQVPARLVEVKEFRELDDNVTEGQSA